MDGWQIQFNIDISLIYSYFQYGQDPLLRQLSKQTGENFDLSPPSGRGDPLLRQLVRNGDYKVVNLEPPRPLTNTFDTLREAAREKNRKYLVQDLLNFSNYR